MALSWNEIKDRAVNFSKEWENESSEDAEAKPFLEAFFNVFGITRKKIATFEHKVKKLNEHEGYIDLFWKGTMLIEMKSKGKDLDKAFQQAKEYTQNLKQEELPKYILVSDFQTFRLYDLLDNNTIEFKLHEFVDNVQHFGFIAGYQKKVFYDQDPVNIQAAELMGKLHDRLKDIGYEGHPLEVYLVRVLFCLFAEDTSIFEKQQFQDYILQRTNEDGSDLAPKLQELFQILNTPKNKRFKNIDEQLNDFPFVNGRLFEENLPTASFDSKMRHALLDCCYFDWSRISPAIFGSMFQSVMNPDERRNLGAHYTSEKNILKVIQPLFMDELWEEFHSIKGNRNKLIDFHKKLANLRFLDPSCGCGNFLVITYREIRLLEIEILKVLNHTGQGFTDIKTVALVDVDQMYGIEIVEFPARIAEVALWLMDHHMNMQTSAEFGQYFLRLPLQRSANIVNANAHRIDWKSLLKPRIIETYFYDMGRKQTVGAVEESNLEFSYIFGNPPFVGHHLQNEQQKLDIDLILGKFWGTGVLDYISAWYIKTAEYMNNTKIKSAFVSTNSIAQGEQVGILWNILFSKYQAKIHFAHRTFKWSNEARGVAAVHCVIIGWATYDTNHKTIYEYENINDENPHRKKVSNISPYLIEFKDAILINRDKPICNIPEMLYGNKPTDGGFYILDDTEKADLLLKEPEAQKYIKPFMSAREFIHGINRWCIWLVDADPKDFKNLPEIVKRIESVRKFRSNSKAKSTRDYKFHTLFRQLTQPKSDYILIPSHSSENRNYIPFGFCSKEAIIGNSCFSIAGAGLYHFGILNSTMHISWVRYTCGRLKSDFRYSKDIVYNNFPWPENPTDKQKQAVEKLAQKVLDVRKEYLESQGIGNEGEGLDTNTRHLNPNPQQPIANSQRPTTTLADLYDPLTMPAKLAKAHSELDKAVDLCYRKAPFDSESRRMEFLFGLYEKYTKDLFSKEKVRKKKGANL